MKQLCSIICFLLLTVSTKAQVNLQTGSATFSLPMFNWQDDKSRLHSIVALSYNSGSGLRVNDVASNAGQGWNLIMGGEITRIQAGEPDDQVAHGLASETDIKKYPSGILYATVPAANGCPTALTKYPIYGWKNQLYAQHNVIAEDRQLDYFSFQFNGIAGLFVLDPNDPSKSGKSLGDSKLKINFQEDPNLQNQGIRTRITSFTIQDENGLIYKFAKHGLTKVLKQSYCDESFNYKQTQPKFKNGKVYYQAGFEDASLVNPWIINNWYLTEIEDALTHRKVFFNYVTRNVNTWAGQDISYNLTSGSGPDKNYGIVSWRKSITQSPEIASITYPDGHSVTVNYGNSRYDLIGEYAIASIDIKYQSRFLSKYILNTAYFIRNRMGNPVSDYEKRMARICLLSVQKIGIDLKEESPPYFFDYYTGSSADDDFVPPPFSYAKDIWGFYNGDYTKGYWNETIPLTSNINSIKNYNQIRGLCYLRDGVSGVYLNAKQGYAKNGLLRQIVYPTGGTLMYQYEQNTGLLNGNQINAGGVHVSQTSSTDENASNPCGNAITTHYNYVLSNGTSSSLWGLETPQNKIVSNNHYQPEWRSYRWNLNCVPFGCCYWHYQFPGILSKQQSINLTGFQKAMEAIAPVLGILNVLTTIQDIITAFGGGNPVSLIIDVIVGIAQVAITCIGNQARDYTATIYINSDLNAAAPLPIQFKRVEVVEGNGGIGKTIQEFTNDEDYPVWVTANSLFTPKQRFATWAYGLPKKTIVYDVNGYKIKETENTYSFSENICDTASQAANASIPICPPKAKRPLFIKSCKCQVNKSYSQRNTNWTNPDFYTASYQLSSSTDLDVDIYDMYSGRVELKSTIEKNYKPSSSAFSEVKTEYEYSASNFEIMRIKKYESNGDVVTKDIRYSNNYFGGVINTMLQDNMVAIPIETVTSVKRGTQTYYLGEQITEFSQLASGDIQPWRKLEQRFSVPVTIMSFYQGPGTSISNYKITQTFTYNTSGNLIGIKDEGGRSISSIYDYDDKYAVATLINADPIADKSAYTSFETSNFGGWMLNGTALYNNGTGNITGERSFALSSGINNLTTSGLNAAKPYIVSFWANVAGITVSPGATLTKTAAGINGLTFYEYDIAQGATSVTISGTGTIDELRILPKTARMRTFTYDPLIGKTSECDENNRITYYEYDNLGRLRFVKDEKKNIVKMNEYNNVGAGKQNGCPGTYYNRFISTIFTKQCAAGYQGSEVVYSIPANTYSSNISQADADAKAEYQLLSNGQAFANANGNCMQIFYNAAISITDTTESCGPGYVGGLVTYTVPAGRYSSIISQADADEKALEDLEANADNYINSPPNAICNWSGSPLWQWLEGAATYCASVNGVMHRFIQETDMNPHSPSYMQTRWSDVGPDDTCPPPVCDSNTCMQQEGYKCINNVCEQGVRINTSSYEDPNIYPFWICVYHYEWSDGTWSQDYYESNPDPCAIY